MSNTLQEFKIGIGIKELLGKTLTEQAEFLKPKFGDDLEIEEYQDKVGHISFNDDLWQLNSGILFYVFDSAESELYSAISLDEIQEIVFKIEKQIKVQLKRENIKIFSASWYDGGDEPCSFFVKKWLEEIKN